VLFKLFFAKEYPTNKTLNTANKILMKNDKLISYFLEKKIVCYKKLSKFEQYFELVSRIVKLKILTRKTDKNTTWK
jgi:lipopolysaccharide biosynthesis regulator YciM